MREHLYRGKRKDNGEWVYGFYIFFKKRKGAFGQVITESDFDRHVICTLKGELIEVIPETVCEYIGLTDKNKKKIFEGDRLSHRSNSFVYTVKFEEGQFKIEDKYGNIVKTTQEAIDWFEMEVIGNIYDNPESLN